MAATTFDSMGYDLLPLTAHDSSLAALGEYLIKSIDNYEVTIHDTIFRAAIGQIAGEQVQDHGTGQFVQRTLRAIHTMVITDRDGFRTFATPNIPAARDAILVHKQRPDLAREALEVVRRQRDVRPSDSCIRASRSRGPHGGYTRRMN